MKIIKLNDENYEKLMMALADYRERVSKARDWDTLHGIDAVKWQIEHNTADSTSSCSTQEKMLITISNYETEIKWLRRYLIDLYYSGYVIKNRDMHDRARKHILIIDRIIGDTPYRITTLVDADQPI